MGAEPDNELTRRAAATAGKAAAAVELAREVGAELTPPGRGQTAQRWDALTDVAAGDLSAARIVEAHLDALAILAEAGDRTSAVPDEAVWGVYAAEGPGVRVDAGDGTDGWTLTGTKPWCSAAAQLDRALVTAHVGASRRLFAVDLHSPTVAFDSAGWVSRGLADVPSLPVTFDGTPAEPVGAAGWYLERPGFAWGGIGVAACWFGGLLGLARRVWSAGGSREPDQVALMHLGQVDLLVQQCRLALADAARRVDAGQADGSDGVLLAERVRGTVAGAVDAVIRLAGHALGPGPLALDDDHARRVADLTVYVRQHHAERDSARLGRFLRDGGVRPW